MFMHTSVCIDGFMDTHQHVNACAYMCVPPPPPPPEKKLPTPMCKDL